ncbi:MAG TPA: MaoC/PaaZ C-terminal domain-containing protein [Spirochaetota bacterium]|nr:MaoC/PaaZ C-terminal domain-containing protein [Spirochaetota bacterium]
MPLNEKVVGKKYQSKGGIDITAHESIYYALAYNEDNDAYFDNRRPGGIIAPPMYAVNYALAPVVDLLFDQETGMNVMMMVHYSQEFEWLLPVKPKDKVKSELTISGIETREKGGILAWQSVCANQNGEVVVKATGEFFDRSAGSGQPDVKKDEKIIPGDILWGQEMKVRNGQTYIYAEPSGDHNVIHIDDDFAKKVGLPGIILQGLCTMAFAHKSFADNCAGPDRDPMKIRKMKVGFSRPVLPGQTLTFQGFKIGPAEGGVKFGLTVKNNEGHDVLRNAWSLIV